MVFTRALALAAAVLMASHAAAQEPAAKTARRADVSERRPASSISPEGTALTVARGERIVVRFGEAGKLVLVSTVIVPFDVMAKDTPTFAPLHSGEIAFTLGGVKETGSIMKVQTALDFSMQYKARAGFFNNGKVELRPTSTCTVLPKVLGIEQWPEPIAYIAIGNIERYEGSPVCR